MDVDRYGETIRGTGYTHIKTDMWMKEELLLAMIPRSTIGQDTSM